MELLKEVIIKIIY